MAFKSDKQRRAFFAMKGIRSSSSNSPRIIRDNKNATRKELEKKGIFLVQPADTRLKAFQERIGKKQKIKTLPIIFGSGVIRDIQNPKLKRRDDLKFGRSNLAVFESKKNKGQFFRAQLIGDKFISISDMSKIQKIK